MKVYIASDHAGFKLKEELKKKFSLEDLGPYEFDAEDDYTDFAEKLCRKILEEGCKGILVCGTGQGMSRMANKFKGVYASPAWDEFTANCAVEHGGCNVITLGERVTPVEIAEKIVKIFLEKKLSSAERHVRRCNKIKEVEKENFR